MDSLWRILTAPFVLARLIRRQQFKLIQGWMYHGNLMAGLGRFLANSCAPLSFGIRQSLYGLERERFNTKWVIRGNAWLSGAVQGCVFNSRFSLGTHRDFGFSHRHMHVIPNGFDLAAFVPQPDRGAALRARLGLGEAPVVGMVARFHPVKGHRDFLRAAMIVHRRQPQVKFLLAGTGVTEGNRQLAGWIDDLGLTGAVQLLGERADIADLNNVFDIACLPSHAEAFPNVVGESMACGTPCVVTDVGDCAEIVGASGRVVPKEDPRSLAAAMLELLDMPVQDRHALGRAARARVVEQFDIDKIAQRYEQYFQMLLGEMRAPQADAMRRE
jgi:glycosyltransferase involved in cell wall biosynthesis